MKIIALFSNVDSFIIAIILIPTVVAFLNVLKKILNKKAISVHSESECNEYDFSQYALHFDNIPHGSNTLGFKSKLILFAISFVLIFVPLSEFIVTMETRWFFEKFTCLGF